MKAGVVPRLVRGPCFPGLRPHIEEARTVRAQGKEHAMRLRIEIRPAEGGDDATRFAKDLAQAYVKALAAEG